jgi:hypothetical protein
MSSPQKRTELRSGNHGRSGSVISPRLPRGRSLRRIIFAISVSALLILALFYYDRRGVAVEETIFHYLTLNNEDQARLHDNQLASLHAGLRQCAQIGQKPVSEFYEDRNNPRAVKAAPPILIVNATLIDGDGSVTKDVSILLSDGIIKQIAHDLDVPENAKVIPAGGRYVSPGIVDMVYFQED